MFLEEKKNLIHIETGMLKTLKLLLYLSIEFYFIWPKTTTIKSSSSNSVQVQQTAL